MHDPNTVAFTIRFPWYRTSELGNSSFRYWEPFITIWHVDPESDGSDDSCGWFTPPLSESDGKIVENLVSWDVAHPWFSSPSLPLTGVVVDPKYSYPQMTPGDALAMVACAWQLIAKEKAHATGRDHGGWRRVNNLTMKEWVHIVHLATYPHDNLRSSLVSHDYSGEQRARNFLSCVMRAYNRFHRPLYKHPRWHIWHWKLQVHPLQSFKRWAFSRCCVCGERFRWGYTPISHCWDSDGPRWFRSEPKVLHSECDRAVRVAR